MKLPKSSVCHMAHTIMKGKLTQAKVHKHFDSVVCNFMQCVFFSSLFTLFENNTIFQPFLFDACCQHMQYWFQSTLSTVQNPWSI